MNSFIPSIALVWVHKDQGPIWDWRWERFARTEGKGRRGKPLDSHAVLKPGEGGREGGRSE